ncbi:30S ribosomal protein S18 [Candidatus Bipolaricaulota bacterium]|nr:30S ribosomal protein S18 [Candidatus Bipolaricaulota bacterium]
MFYKRKRICRICEQKSGPDYKKPEVLKQYMNRLGKILPKRATRLCTKHQRHVALQINRARKLALLPYVGEPRSIPDARPRRRR